jgi:OOP family OmpA-OmpF porin
MNKLLFAAALSVAGLAPLTAQVARADDSNQLNNFFVSGSLGQSNYRNDFSHNNSVFQNLSFGWRWNGLVGPEVGYTFLGRPRDISNGSDAKIKSEAAILGVNGKYDFYGNWFVTAHGGYLRSRTKTEDALVDGGSINHDSMSNGWYAGAGVGYDVTKNVSVGINYDNYHVKYDLGDAGTKSNIAAYTATVQYSF